MDTKINLLVLEVKWPPETFIYRQLIGLRDRGYQITVGVPSVSVSFPKVIDGIKIIKLPRPESSIFLRLVMLLGNILLLVLKQNGFHRLLAIINQSSGKDFRSRFNFLLRSIILLKISPDIVHFEWNSSAIAYKHLLPLWGCPNVVSCRGRQINILPFVQGNEKYKQEVSDSFHSASAVHCVSLAIQKEAQKYGLDIIKSKIIPPAVDPSDFIPLDETKENNEFSIITTGSLIWRKGYEYALLALRHVLDRGVNSIFHILGDGPEKQRILYTITDLGLEGKVILHGKQSPEKVRQLLQKANVFLLSSLSEGLSNAVLEAMSCGLPIITTDCGGMREAVADGIEGFVVPVRNPQVMAEKLLLLARDPSLCAQMGTAGHQRVISDFSLEKQINAFVDLYSQVLTPS